MLSYLSMISNHTAGGLCQTNEMISQIGNLTASYTSKGGQELMIMVAAPAIMFILVGLFFGGIFSFSAILDPNFRFLLSSALAVFLLVMSYLFSEAKDKAGGGGDGDLSLSVRARVILTWMLLVELLRKKVDEIRVRGSYSSTIQRAGRVVWLGSLIYFNIRSPGQKALFSVLWILCATKLVQRIVFAELEKRSCPDMSWIISSYMAQVLQEVRHDEETQGDPMKMCPYIVMGEEKMSWEATADGGYKLQGHDIDIDAAAITVGRVWRRLDDVHGLPLVHKDVMRIKRLCLSFALFKLLRRSFELGPGLTTQEAEDCRNLIGNGLYSRREEGNSSQQQIQDSASSLLIFQVMADEVRFASEYYHSVVPVVLASPSFVLVNYFLLPVVVLGLCLIALAACGSGDLRHVLSRMAADNYYLLQPGPGLANTVKCALVTTHYSRPASLLVVDLSVTLVLFAILFMEEIWELLVVLTSNWFMISTLWKWFTAAGPGPIAIAGDDGGIRRQRFLSRALGFTLWLWRKMRRTTRKSTTNSNSSIRPLKQLCLLDRSVPFFVSFLTLMPSTLCLKLRTSAPVTVDLKRCVVEYLVSHLQQRATPLDHNSRRSTMLRAIARHGHDDWYTYYSRSSSLVPDTDSVTEAILTWHIATSILETELRPSDSAHYGVAVSLSRYCAYLVVFHPELLPDRRAKAELVLLQARKELLHMLGFWGYYLALRRARVKMLLRSPVAGARDDGRRPCKAVSNGVNLGRSLLDESEPWEELAAVWVELTVCAALSSDEEHANAHKDNLAGGVDLITLLWAFATHTGLERAKQRLDYEAPASY